MEKSHSLINDLSKTLPFEMPVILRPVWNACYFAARLECKIYFAARLEYKINFAARLEYKIYFAARLECKINFALICFRSTHFLLRKNNHESNTR